MTSSAKRDLFHMQKQKQFFSAKDVLRGIVERIRNPLNALHVNIDNLEGEINELKIADATDIPELLGRMRNTLTEMDYLLSGVLRVVDLPRPNITPVNINASVRELESFVKPESSAKEIILKVDLQENLPEIQADSLQVKQAILNLLLNAIEACAIGGSITLATEAKNNHIIVKVTDNGEGILLPDRDRIFEPFFSTKEPCAGLGLALALQIVKTHRGTIFFKSQVGKGTTFFISLPTKRVMGRK